jgi:hypothetical protein
MLGKFPGRHHGYSFIIPPVTDRQEPGRKKIVKFLAIFKRQQN